MESQEQQDQSAPAPLLPDDLIDWPKRLAVEEGLLVESLADAPSKRILDLGCGTGRHARFLGERGFEVVGIDGSELALERARAEPVPAGVEFLLGEIGAVERCVRGHFGAALCLGNTLPELLSAESVSRMLVGVKRRLIPGAPVLIQTLNFDRPFTGDGRALPVEFVPDSQGEMAVFRAVEPRGEGIFVMVTSVWRYSPTSVPAMEPIETRARQVRGWTREELGVLLDVARLPVREVFGDMRGAPFDPEKALELVVLAG